LATDVTFISDAEVIGLTPEGFLTLKIKDTGGLENDAGELAIKLETISGLSLSIDGLTVETQGVMSIDLNGILLNIGDGLENDGADNLQVALAVNSGLEFVGGDLSLDLADDSILELGPGGVSVDKDEMYKRHVAWG